MGVPYPEDIRHASPNTCTFRRQQVRLPVPTPLLSGFHGGDAVRFLLTDRGINATFGEHGVVTGVRSPVSVSKVVKNLAFRVVFP